MPSGDPVASCRRTYRRYALRLPWRGSGTFEGDPVALCRFTYPPYALRLAFGGSGTFEGDPVALCRFTYPPVCVSTSNETLLAAPRGLEAIWVAKMGLRHASFVRRRYPSAADSTTPLDSATQDRQQSVADSRAMPPSSAKPAPSKRATRKHPARATEKHPTHATAAPPTSNAETRAYLLAAASVLTKKWPLDKIDAAKIARQAKVSWPTVRRHLGDKIQLRELLQKQFPGLESSDSTTERLLVSASYVFAQRGYAGATLDEVADLAGMTKGAVYWHFRNKAELFLALMQSRDLQLENLGERALSMAQVRGKPEQRLAQILAQHFEVLISDQLHLRLYVEFLAAARDGSVTERLAAAYTNQRAVIARLIRNLSTQGLIARKAPVDDIAQLLLLLFDGFVMMALVDPAHAESKRLAADLAGLLSRGLEQYWVK